MKHPLILSIVLLLVPLAGLHATDGPAPVLRLAGLFHDHMVLQRDTAVPVWGWAAAGDDIRITFASQSKTAHADVTGRWQTNLDPMPASEKANDLLVTTSNPEAKVQNQKCTDVLVGEVWLCSGQSNMEMPVARACDAEREIAGAKFPQLRVFKVEHQTALTPQSNCGGSWTVCSPETAGRFSATVYFFGRELHQDLKVPVGLIVAAWSGSAIEAWTSFDVQKQRPELKTLLASWEQQDADYSDSVAAAAIKEYTEKFQQWKTAVKQARVANKKLPKAPRRPVNPRDHWHHPAVLFNGMIAPLIPYALRGTVWYQGESNADSEESSALYAMQLPLMVNDWRARWGRGDFPFGWVQLPTISATAPHWARMRESMLAATVLPNTGMAITIDLGEPHLLHPKGKQAFGHRLALWARAQVYGENISWSGPLPAGHEVRGSEIVLSFTHTDGGLKTKDGVLKSFLIAGEDKVWKPAVARIEGNQVIVSSTGVKSPVAVRYAWANEPELSLYNNAGLPAPSFCTDTWIEPNAVPTANKLPVGDKAK